MQKRSDMFTYFCLSSSLVIILFCDNDQLHVAWMTLLNLTDLGYKADILLIAHRVTAIFFKDLDTFWHQKTFHSKGK